MVVLKIYSHIGVSTFFHIDSIQIPAFQGPRTAGMLEGEFSPIFSVFWHPCKTNPNGAFKGQKSHCPIGVFTGHETDHIRAIQGPKIYLKFTSQLPFMRPSPHALPSPLKPCPPPSPLLPSPGEVSAHLDQWSKVCTMAYLHVSEHSMLFLNRFLIFINLYF